MEKKDDSDHFYPLKYRHFCAAKYGIIFNSFNPKSLGTLNLSGTLTEIIKNADGQFQSNKSRGLDAEGYGSIFKSTNRLSLDAIILNSDIENPVLSMTDRIVHEMGHNFTNNPHGRTTYIYSEPGLQSGDNPRPNSNSKINIINTNPIRDIYDKVIYGDETRS